jgi:hypothetical protein
MVQAYTSLIPHPSFLNSHPPSSLNPSQHLTQATIALLLRRLFRLSNNANANANAVVYAIVYPRPRMCVTYVSPD